VRSQKGAGSAARQGGTGIAERPSTSPMRIDI
jgi:hypothetical protein